MKAKLLSAGCGLLRALGHALEDVADVISDFRHFEPRGRSSIKHALNPDQNLLISEASTLHDLHRVGCLRCRELGSGAKLQRSFFKALDLLARLHRDRTDSRDGFFEFCPTLTDNECGSAKCSTRHRTIPRRCAPRTKQPAPKARNNPIHRSQRAASTPRKALHRSAHSRRDPR